MARMVRHPKNLLQSSSDPPSCPVVIAKAKVLRAAREQVGKLSELLSGQFCPLTGSRVSA